MKKKTPFQRQRTKRRVRQLSQLFVVLSMMTVGVYILGNSFAEVPSQSYYAAPTGTAAGDGSLEKPWDLKTALLNKTVINPGDNLWLRAGTYGTGAKTTFVDDLNGSREQPITIRNYNNERATIDGNITVNGNYNRLWGLEVTNSFLERNTTLGERVGGLTLYGKGGYVGRIFGWQHRRRQSSA